MPVRSRLGIDLLDIQPRLCVWRRLGAPSRGAEDATRSFDFPRAEAGRRCGDFLRSDGYV